MDAAEAEAVERAAAELRSILSLLERLRRHDETTYRHARSVGLWCRKLSLELGASSREADFVERCGALHDIGKILTPLAVLNKPGPLGPEEWSVMKAHAANGADICAETPGLDRYALVVRAHHERVDGTGYPDRLRAADIPIEALIVSVADSFHAMISQRGYAVTKSPRDAFGELERGRGTQFDGTVVAGFFRLVGYRGAAAAAAANRTFRTA